MDLGLNNFKLDPVCGRFLAGAAMQVDSSSKFQERALLCSLLFRK
jgi:hypothetical protein